MTKVQFPKAIKNTYKGENMKILLVLPACGNWRGVGKKKLFNGKTFRFSMLPLLTVAGLTPKKHTVTIVDEQIEDIPFDEKFDLVGINTMTATANRAYEISDYFRNDNVPVVLGGVHASLNPEEAKHYSDAVVIGPAYDAWQRLLKDVESGNLKKEYQGNPAGTKPIHLPKHLLKRSQYISLNATYATLGCKNKCSYCTVSAMYKSCQYHRKVEEVVEELKGFEGKFVLFADDNLTQDRDYCISLLKAIIPLKKKWVSQASLEIADDNELLQVMKDSGCVGLFIGLETFSEESLKQQNKTVKSPAHYKKAIKKLHSYGILVESGIVFGFDSDRKDVFRSTLSMLGEIGVDIIQASILTPLPGTPLFDAMRERIVDWNWEHYDFKYAVFNPANMSREDLKAGTEWVVKQFYAPQRIIKRFFRWCVMPGSLASKIYPLFLNIAYLGRVIGFKLQGYDPSTESDHVFDKLVEMKNSPQHRRMYEEAA